MITFKASWACLNVDKPHTTCSTLPEKDSLRIEGHDQNEETWRNMKNNLSSVKAVFQLFLAISRVVFCKSS